MAQGYSPDRQVECANAFVKVFTALEYLKLFDRTPDMCLLGTIQMTRDEEQCRKYIRGNLGVALRALSRLQDPFEHTLTVKPIAKTNVNDELIVNDLLKWPRKKGNADSTEVDRIDEMYYGHAVYRSSLIPGGAIGECSFVPARTEPGDLAWTIREGKVEEDKRMRITDLTVEHVEYLRHAAGLGIMNVRDGADIHFFNDFVQKIVEGDILLNPDGTVVLVNSNLSVPHRAFQFYDRHLDGFRTACRKLAGQVSPDALWVSVGNQDLSALSGIRESGGPVPLVKEARLEELAVELSRTLRSRILYHDRTHVALFDEDGKLADEKAIGLELPESQRSHFLLQGSADVLNATFLLALCAREAMARAAGDREDPLWSEAAIPHELASIDWHDCVRFAQAVATNRLFHLRELTDRDADHVIPPSRYQIHRRIDPAPPDETAGLKADGADFFEKHPYASLRALYGLSHYKGEEERTANIHVLHRIVNHSRNTPLLRMVAMSLLRYLNLEMLHRTERRVRQEHFTRLLEESVGRPKDARNVALWDLDHTLMASSEVYERCAWRGLSVLRPVAEQHRELRSFDDKRKFQRECLDIARFLYNHHRDFEGRELASIDGPIRIESFRRVWFSEPYFAAFLAVFCSSQLRQKVFSSSVELETGQIIDNILESARGRREAFKDDIREACRACEKQTVDLFRHISEVLANAEIAGIENYVVTEGHEENQRWKWRNSSLCRKALIPEWSLLTTFGAGKGTMDLPNLDAEVGRLERGQRAADERLLSVLRTVQKRVKGFMDKSQQDFYVIVLRAVAALPYRASAGLKLVDIPDISEAESHPRVVMIGDSYDKDIVPVKAIDDGIGAIMCASERGRLGSQIEGGAISGTPLYDAVKPSAYLILDTLLDPAYWSDLKSIDTERIRLRQFTRKGTGDLEPFLIARDIGIQGIRAVVDTMLAEIAREVGWKEYALAVFAAAMKADADDQVKISALQSLEVLPHYAVDDEDLLVENMQKVFADLQKWKDDWLLDQLLRVARSIGHRRVARWLVGLLNDDESYDKLQAADRVAEAMAACEEIGRRLRTEESLRAKWEREHRGAIPAYTAQKDD